MRALLWLGLLSRLVLTQCELDIALNARNWTISDSAENPIVLFCNRSSTQAACVQPLLPNHITTWLVLGRAQPGHAEMRFDFPNECFPYVGFDLELLNIFTVADGPVIQKCNQVALNNGMSLKLLFEQLKYIRKEVSIPLLLMGSFNPVFKFGVPMLMQGVVTILRTICDCPLFYVNVNQSVSISRGLLINPDPVYEHFLRKDCTYIRIAGPITSDSNI